MLLSPKKLFCEIISNTKLTFEILLKIKFLMFLMLLQQLLKTSVDYR